MISNNLFWIKRGDTRPSIQATITDASGNPQNLNAATSITFKMVDLDGNVILNKAAAFVDKPNGLIAYNWAVGDTNQSGDFLTEWMITWADATTQKFPSSGYNRVTIASDVDDGSLAVNLSQVIDLRKSTGETGDTLFTDPEMAEYYAARGEKAAAAYDVWMDKAATYANLIDVGEQGSTRNLTALQRQALTMADRWKSDSIVLNATSVRRATTTRAIVRA
jgi:hypothetical protein